MGLLGTFVVRRGRGGGRGCGGEEGKMGGSDDEEWNGLGGGGVEVLYVPNMTGMWMIKKTR